MPQMIANLVLTWTGGLCIGLSIGWMTANNVAEANCDVLGKFRLNDVVYICHREK